MQEGTAYADYGDATNRQFAYNGRGELTSGIGYLGTNVTSQAAPLPGRRHEYAYDSIGNRQWSNSTGVSGLRDEANSREMYRPFRALCFRFTREPMASPWAGDMAPLWGSRFPTQSLTSNPSLRHL
ncbi:MAG: hypothetical protein HS122_19965 [Opitutaceae bacterium]|nr:hypothetical protein [Opitutaceae bacterium]